MFFSKKTAPVSRPMSSVKALPASSAKMHGLVRQARQWAHACQALFKSDSVLKPSGFWVENTQRLRGWLETSDDPEEIFRLQVENNGFTYPRKKDDPAFTKVCNSYTGWLKRHQLPLHSLPLELQESWMTRDSYCTTIDERKVSVMFFWHLCALMRIHTLIPAPPRTTMEIGGGYGGLARLAKHFYPQCQYMILDLPTSLLYAYLYLAQHFPEARILWVTEASALKQLDNESYDFVFVPCSLEEKLHDHLECDLLINTASLGEMSQGAVDWYIDLIENHLDVRYFYFINRYGHFTDKRVEHLSHNCCVHFDARWRMHAIAIEDEHTVNRLDDYFPRHLEFFAERLPASAVSPGINRVMAEQLLEKAKRCRNKDDAFELLAYESARISPTPENTVLYLDFLKEKGFHEYERFKQYFGERR